MTEEHVESADCWCRPAVEHVEADDPAMTAPARAEALRRGEEIRDGYGRPLTRNDHGEWVNERGDTPCPNDGEMTNRRCWKCGWIRAAD